MTDYTVAYWEANKSTLDSGPAFGIDDTAADISAALDQLNTDPNIVQIVVSDNNPVVVDVAQISSDSTAISLLVNANSSAATLTVNDTAANISLGFATLGTDTQVKSIVISDNNIVVLTASQVANNTTAVGELINANTTAAQVEVKDTATSIATNLNALQAEGSTIVSIVVSNSAVMTLTASQIANDGGALAKVSNNNSGAVTFDVADTAANISTYLNQLQANAQVTSIAVTDSATNEVTVMVAQLTSDATALAELYDANGTTPASVTVSDTAANISAGLGTLNGDSQVNKIVVTDSASNEVTVSVAQLASDATALAELYDANGTTKAGVTVSDTAANISQPNFTGLNDNTQVNKIIVTNSATSEVTMSVADALHDTTALAELYDANGTTLAEVTVVDTAASITGDLNALNSATRVNKIVVDNSASAEVTATVAQATSDTTALGELYDVNGTTRANVTVSDTAANISTGLTGLNGNSQVNKIEVSNSATAEVTTTVAQLTSDATALGELYDANGTTPASVTVSDTAANIGADLGPLGSDTQVNKIEVSNSASAEVTVSVAQLTSDSTALGELFDANGTTAANVTVSDTAANISTGLNSLNSDSQVNKIIVTDSASNEVLVSVAQLTSDATALAELYDANGTTKASVTVSDVAANISADLGALNSDTQVNKIIVTDSASNEVTVTVAALSDGTALSELYDANGTTKASITVADVAANLSGATFTLLNNNSQINKIVVTDSASNEVTITAAQAGADTAALGELYDANGTTKADVTVSDTAADISAAIAALNGNTQVNKIIVSDSASNEVTVTVAQLTGDTTALGELYDANGSTAASVTVADTAANITTALGTLNGDSQVNKIEVTDSGSNEVTVSVAQLTSDATALAELYDANGTTKASVTVSDVAANISADLGALNSDTQVNKIIVTDSASNEVTVTVAALSDGTALSELYDANGTTKASITVADVAANLSGATFTLLNNNSQINKIVVTDSASNEVTITAAQAGADTAALGELYDANGTTPASVTVSDTAANISGAIGSLNGDTQVNKIVVTDSASNEVTISTAQLASDTTALGELYDANGTTPANVTISDTAANITSNLGTLNGDSQVNKIVVSDSAVNEVVVSVAQLASDATALGELYNANGTTAANITVSDTAAHVSADLGGLNGDSQVNKIIVTDSASNEVTVSVAQLSSDTTALGELYDANGTTKANVTVSDTAADISAAIGTLNTNTQVNKIIVSDSATNEVKVTFAQLTTDTTALGELYDANGTTSASVTVADTAANLSNAAFTTLNNDTQVNKIIVTNSGSAEVVISGAEATNDTTALGELYNSNGTTPAHVTVSDTAAHITTDLGLLNSNTHVNKIEVSNSATAEVVVTVAQLTTDATALAELYNAAGSALATVTVSDTAANIQADLGPLGSDTQVNKIEVSNSATTEVTVSVAQLTTDAAALAELYNAAGTAKANVTVSDIAANISADFTALNGNSQVNKIIVTDSASNEVTISAAQAGADTAALAELYDANGTTLASVTVSDTASDISGAFNALNGNTQVNKIIVTDSASNEVTITAAQAASDTAALAELYQANGTTAADVTVSDTAADISGAFGALNGNTHVNKIVVSDSASNEVTISTAQLASDTTALGELYDANGTTPANVTISDTAANVSSDLGTLNGDSQVNKIVVSDSAVNQVIVNVAQLTSDATALGELYDANGTTKASVTVSDTAADISADVGGLNGDSQVNKIVVSDSASNEVTVTVAQLSDTTALGELYDANGTTSASITVSDTAANISADLGGLNSDTQVNKIIISDNGTITLTAAAAVSDSTAIGELHNQNNSTVTLKVVDTAANIATYLTQLNAETTISSIVISDSAPLTLTASDIANDTVALGKLSNQNGSGVEINVVDTAADISPYLSQLQANDDIVSVTVSDSAPITVTVAEITSDALILSELQNANSSPILLTVRDTAANIDANLASLAQNHQVTGIVISDNNPLKVTIAQITSDAAALAETTNANGSPYTLTVSDNSTNISSALNTLNSNTHVKSIIVTNSSAISVNVAQITSDATALSELTNNNSTPYTLQVTDTAADISAAFNALNGNSHVAQIIVSDSASNEVTISVAQLASDATALGELYDANGTTAASVTVADTAANISGAIGSLNGDTQVNKIVVTDSASNEVTISTAQLASDATALGELFDANGTTAANVTVADTASNITGDLGSLNSDIQVNKIVVTNSATSEVTVSVAQLTGDATALGELYDANGTTAANVTVSDTAANITGDLGSLNGDTQVNKIVVTDSASNEVTVSAAQLTGDATALGELYDANGTTKANVTVSDVAANITSSLNTLGGNTQVNKIVVTDSASNEVTVSVAQLTSDAAALAELYDANGTTKASVTVSDTAANISQPNFTTLNNDTQVNKIIVTNSASAEVVMSGSDAEHDTTALNELYDANGTTLASITVSDTAAHISTDLNELNGNTRVNKIIVSNGPTNEVSVSVAQLTSDATALGELYNPNGHKALIDVTDTAANISAALNALEANTAVTLITVSNNASVVVTTAQLSSDAAAISELVNANATPVKLTVQDTAANIQANLGNLNSNAMVNKVVVSNSSSAEVTVSVAQLTSDATVLGELFDANGTTLASIVVSDTAVNIAADLNALNADTQISSIVDSNSAALSVTAVEIGSDTHAIAELSNRNGNSVTFQVSDTAANISANINALETENSHISTITDSNSGMVSVSYSNYTADHSVIGKIVGPYELQITGITGQAYSSVIESIDATGHIAQEEFFENNGSLVFEFNENGQSFSSNGTATVIEMLNGSINDNFTFTGAFGSLELKGYVPGSDALAFDHHDFANLSALEAAAHQSSNGNTVITLDAHDIITIENVTLAQFEANTSEITFF